jgi:hypothetical protein
MAKAQDEGSKAVEEGTTGDPSAANEMRNARRDNAPDPTPEQKADFPVQSTGDAVWITNRNGGTHSVPGDWVTEDDMGVVRVRGNLGYRYASDEEVSEAREAQGLDQSDQSQATQGAHSANADKFSAEGSQPGQEPQTATLGHATVGMEAKGAKGA